MLRVCNPTKHVKRERKNLIFNSHIITDQVQKSLNEQASALGMKLVPNG
jgi:hypothetical protein